MARKKSSNTHTLQEKSEDMKAEMPPHHKPLSNEEATSSEASTDDVIDCLSKLSICHSEAQIVKSNILPEKEKEVKKEDKREEEKKEEPKKEQKKETDEPNGEAKTKRDEKAKDPKESEAGGLLSRGPVGVEPKWKADALASSLPYPVTKQINSGLTNGGCLLYDGPSTITSHSMSYSNLPSQNLFADQEITQQFNITPLTVSELSDEAPYHQSSYNQNLTTEDSHFLDYAQGIDFNVCEPVETYCQDEDIRKYIKDITNDPTKVANLIKSLTRKNECQILPDPSSSIRIPSTYNILEPDANAYSPLMQTQSQVVPQRRLSRSSSSAYSTGSGSPSGPLSPNIYGKVPNFSPNVPSPNVYSCEDSNNLYSPPYMNTMTSPMTSPQSCLSASTNCSCAEVDTFDLEKILNEPDIEEKNKIKVIKEELNNSCSENYAKFAYPNPNNQIASPNHQIASPNSSLVMVLQGALNQNPLPRRTTEVVSSRTPYRKILPKPSDTTLPDEKPVSVQDLYMKQSVRPNRTPQGLSPKTAKFQLLQKLDPVKLKCAMHKILMLKDESIASVDKDGDTPLMIQIAKPEILQKLEELYALVEKCKTIPGLLDLRNQAGQSALFMACMLVRNEPYVPIYIAQSMVDINCDLNLRNKKTGSTLIHELCIGDDFAPLLDELLSLRDNQNKKCFNINIPNYDGLTPLHLTVENHNKGIPSLKLVKVLISHGANILEKEHKQGSNALHLALATSNVDEKLINLLFQCCDNATNNAVSGNISEIKYKLVNAKNFNDDTPLHVAMAYGNSVESQTQNYIVDVLMKAGAVRAIRNHNGKAPLELAPESRKPATFRCL